MLCQERRIPAQSLRDLSPPPQCEQGGDVSGEGQCQSVLGAPVCHLHTHTLLADAGTGHMIHGMLRAHAWFTSHVTHMPVTCLHAVFGTGAAGVEQ